MTAGKFIERAFPLIGDRRLWQKDIRLDGRKSPPDTAVTPGQRVTVYYPGSYSFKPDILFNDGRLLALQKPAGLPVDADIDCIGADTVLTRLKTEFPSARLVHRLDTGTSGVMLAALDDKTQLALENMFREHCFRKRYIADALGVFSKPHEVLDGFLIKDAASATVWVVSKKTQNSKEIQTIYDVIGTRSTGGRTVTRLCVEIPTGRTHQIRAHLASIGHPLLGDDKYGDRAANKALNARHLHLHCQQIEVIDGRLLPEYSGMIFACKDTDPWK